MFITLQMMDSCINTINNEDGSGMMAPSRVCTTLESLEELIMDITSHDLNLQMQQLIADYKRTGDEHLRLDAEYLRSEFDTWWDNDESMFVPPAQI